MTTEVTVSLPDAMYRNALQLAELTQRDLAELLTETLTLSLPEVTPGPEGTQALSDLSDDDVLDLTVRELPPEQDSERVGCWNANRLEASAPLKSAVD